MSTAVQPPHAFSTHKEKKALLARLARVEGQVRGVQRMIENEEDCGRIAQQLAAARGALNKAFFELIACAFEARVTDEESSSVRRSSVAELAELLAKYA